MSKIIWEPAPFNDHKCPWNFRVNLHFFVYEMGVVLGLETAYGSTLPADAQ